MVNCFSHCVFLFLHLLACIFGFVGLFVTIPLHVIFIAIARKR